MGLGLRTIPNNRDYIILKENLALEQIFPSSSHPKVLAKTESVILRDRLVTELCRPAAKVSTRPTLASTTTPGLRSQPSGASRTSLRSTTASL